MTANNTMAEKSTKKNFFEMAFAPTPEIETKKVGKHVVAAQAYAYSPLFK